MTQKFNVTAIRTLPDHLGRLLCWALGLSLIPCYTIVDILVRERIGSEYM